MNLDTLARLEDAPAVVMSCPGPLRRHGSALMAIGTVALPQVLLGSESQLLAFAAAMPGLSGKLFFAPLPEMFPDSASLSRAVVSAGGQQAEAGGRRFVHLRFGSVRAARVLKGAQNCCVIAEAGGAAPLTASHHPFASGRVLPAAVRRLYVYGPDSARPHPMGGEAIAASRLPPSCITADLPKRADWVRPAALAEGGMDLVSLAEFRSLAWAAGPVRPRGARALLGAGAGPAVLLPWNMDHPGSIVPDLLERLARLHSLQAGSPALPRIVLLPFNYIGQTGIIRRLIARLREAADSPEALLSGLFLGRLHAMSAVSALRGISRTAWVDGNDPEHWWTLARLEACGIDPILIDPAQQGGAGGLAADEAIWVEGETRCGALTFPARLPSLRMLPRLLALTEAREASLPAPKPRRKPRRQPEAAAGEAEPASPA